MSRAYLANGLVLGGVLLLVAQLHAEPGPAPAPAAPTDTIDVSKLSPQDLQARADQMVTQLNADIQHAQVAQARANKAKDRLKLNCVNDGLLITKQLVNVGEDARGKLEKAIQANDRAEQQTQFQSLAGALKSADQSKGNIDGCIGGSEVTITGPNGSKVTVIHPVTLDNPTADCNSLGLANCITQPLEYVAYASPFSPN